MSLTYFAAEDNFGNEQLWVTDGTVAGAHVVKGFTGSSITNLMMIGGRVYFRVDDGVHGSELWTSDGTAAGTVLVLDINPGLGSSSPALLTNANGTLFFAAVDGTHGFEPWISDGTAAGTTLLKDVQPGSGGSIAGFPFANVNGSLFFSAFDSTNGVELWKSDGTAAGTVLVKDINPGGDSSPHELTDVNGTLFFFASDGTNGAELWKSDGTAAGTVMVRNINPGAGGSFTGAAGDTANVNGTLFFAATDGTHGAELWKSDGTAAGTVMVRDIDPGGTGSGPEFLTKVNNTLFFAADDGTHGLELWKSDGTAAGTQMVKDITSGAAGSISATPFANVDGTLFFAATDQTNGIELWKSDGTTAGTVMVKDIVAGAGNSNPFGFTNVNGVVEFYAFDGTGEGLFRSDGTAAGTIELATNVDASTPIGFSAQPVVNDMNGTARSDVLWRNADGSLAGWLMNRGLIQSSGTVTSSGVAAMPDPTWSVAGISDFNGDGNADVLWRNSDGTLVGWSMTGATITASGVLNAGGTAVKPDATWSVVGSGDFDGDTRADILWRNTDGSLAEWRMNGSNIVSSGFVTSAGTPAKPDSSWSVAGIGDFNGDNRRDVLWRNADGSLAEWNMNGATITSSGELTAAGVPARPDATWSVAGVGDFNADGNSDILWRNANGSLAEWQLNGMSITGSGNITQGGVAVTPDATWHIVEVGDFNGDSQFDVLWRNDNGALAEWLMNGTAIVSSVTPNAGGMAVAPDATWSPQARPANFG